MPDCSHHSIPCTANIDRLSRIQNSVRATMGGSENGWSDRTGTTGKHDRTDLIKEIKKWQQTNNDIILMIDANEQLDQHSSGIAKLLTSCNLIDAIAGRHHQATTTATYTRGTKQIDFILTSAHIAQAVTGSGLLAFFDGIHSDHRGSFIDIDTRHIFQDKTPNLYDQPMRQLHSKNQKSVQQYKTELWKQMTSHNILQRSQKICTESSRRSHQQQLCH